MPSNNHRPSHRTRRLLLVVLLLVNAASISFAVYTKPEPLSRPASLLGGFLLSGICLSPLLLMWRPWPIALRGVGWVASFQLLSAASDSLGVIFNYGRTLSEGLMVASGSIMLAILCSISGVQVDVDLVPRKQHFSLRTMLFNLALAGLLIVTFSPAYKHFGPEFIPPEASLTLITTPSAVSCAILFLTEAPRAMRLVALFVVIAMVLFANTSSSLFLSAFAATQLLTFWTLRQAGYRLTRPAWAFHPAAHPPVDIAA